MTDYHDEDFRPVLPTELSHYEDWLHDLSPIYGQRRTKDRTHMNYMYACNCKWIPIYGQRRTKDRTHMNYMYACNCKWMP